MSKEDLQGGSAGLLDMIADIVRETSPAVRWCFLAGIAAGVVLGGYVTYGATNDLPGGPSDVTDRTFTQFVALIFIICLFAGGFVGLVVGVVIELVLKRFQAAPPAEAEEDRN